MAIAHPTGMATPRDSIQIRKIGLSDVRAALLQGCEDFMAKRGDLVFIGFIYPLVILLAGLYAYDVSLLPLIFPLLAGSILLGPVVASGFYELARRRELGLDTRWRHFLDVLRGPAALSIVSLTSILVLLFLLWLTAAWLIYSATLGASGAEPPTSLATLLNDAVTTFAGWKMIVFGNLVGLGFAILALAISVISFPMLVDAPVGWKEAMDTSLRVTWHNPVTIAAWGLIVVVLLVLGSIPAFVGLAVVLPVLGYATWHLYTRAVVR